MTKKIIIICFKYPPEYSGYGKQLQSVISNIQKENQQNDYEFILLTGYESSLKEQGKNFKVIPLGTKKAKKANLYFYMFCFKTFVWLLINNRKYSLIHCIKAGPEAALANVVSKIFKKDIIIKVAQDELSYRETEKSKGFKKITQKLRYLLLKNANNYIAISEEIEKNITNLTSKNTKIYKIPNGVDDEKYLPESKNEKESIREYLNIAKREIVILYAGAINKRKGIIDLLKSIELLNVTKNCQLIICGPILEDIGFENKINHINKNKNNIKVSYLGQIKNVEDYMKAADIFVLPSYSEGLPNVLLEAGSTGLALVATDIGGNKDIIIPYHNGLLTPLNNPEILSESFKMLIEDEKLRAEMGANSRYLIKQRFSLKYVANSYIKLYNKLLTK